MDKALICFNSSPFIYKLFKSYTGNLGGVYNIDKDRVVREAHVCVFNKKEDGTDYTQADWDSDPRPDLYAELPDGTLEKAPEGYGIEFNHTYLHLVINTYNPDIADPDDTTDDVFLDFTDIMGAAAIEAMNSSIIDHEERITEIEGSYVAPFCAIISLKLSSVPS